MDQTHASSSPTSHRPPAGTDDVWGVNRPPVLPPTTASSPATTSPAPTGPSSVIDRGLGALHRSPLRRDTRRGVLGGVAAGLAARTGASPAAIRLGVVVLSLALGAGVAAYLLAWALLPDERGSTHAERALHDGRPASLAVVGLAALPVLGLVLGVVGSAWPLLLAAAAVAYVMTRRTGHPATHAHG